MKKKAFSTSTTPATLPVSPLPLKPGDAVALIAPASPATKEQLDKAALSLRFLGLVPHILPGCRHGLYGHRCSSAHDPCRGYLAGTDQQRADDLIRAFTDSRFSGIFCLRGGYGSARLLPLLDARLIRRNPKVFVGYSDITALHLFLNQQCGLVTYHGPMPSVDYRFLDSLSLASLRFRIFDTDRGSYSHTAGHAACLLPGTASGILTGGNLTVVASTLGSPYEIDTRGKLLFLEDVNEPLYRIDRALTALALAGKLTDCAGLVFGTFSGCGEGAENNGKGSKNNPQAGPLLKATIRAIVQPYGKPALIDLPAGHVYPQLTLPLGAAAVMDADRGVLSFLPLSNRPFI